MSRANSRSARAVFGIALIVVWLVSCMSHAQEFSVLKQGVSAGLMTRTAAIRVVADERELAKFFAELSADELPAPQPPNVDFNQHIVVFASLGQKPTAGYSVQIESIACQGGTLKVNLKAVAPAPGAVLAQVVTHPFVLAATARCAGLTKVKFSGSPPVPIGELAVN